MIEQETAQVDFVPARPLRPTFCSHPARRCKDVEASARHAGMDTSLRLFGWVSAPKKLETMAHRHFASKRIQCEWFDVKPEEVLEFLKLHASQTETFQ